jgi:hypothetical protein
VSTEDRLLERERRCLAELEEPGAWTGDDAKKARRRVSLGARLANVRKAIAALHQIEFRFGRC